VVGGGECRVVGEGRGAEGGLGVCWGVRGLMERGCTNRQQGMR